MPSILYHLERSPMVFDLDVEYEVAALIPASGPDMSGPGSPEEGGEITSLLVTVAAAGATFELTDFERDAIEAFIYANHDYSDTGYEFDHQGWEYD